MRREKANKSRAILFLRKTCFAILTLFFTVMLTGTVSSLAASVSGHIQDSGSYSSPACKDPDSKTYCFGQYKMGVVFPSQGTYSISNVFFPVPLPNPWHNSNETPGIVVDASGVATTNPPTHDYKWSSKGQTRNTYYAGTGLQNAYFGFVSQSTAKVNSSGQAGDNEYAFVEYGHSDSADIHVATIGSGERASSSISCLASWSPYRPDVKPPGPDNFGKSNVSSTSSTAIKPVGKSVQNPIYPTAIFQCNKSGQISGSTVVNSPCGTTLYYRSSAAPGGSINVSSSSSNSEDIGAWNPVDPLDCRSSPTSSSSSGGGITLGDRIPRPSRPTYIGTRPVVCNSLPAGVACNSALPYTKENFKGLQDLVNDCSRQNGAPQLRAYEAVPGKPPAFDWSAGEGDIMNRLSEWASGVYVYYRGVNCKLPAPSQIGIVPPPVIEPPYIGPPVVEPPCLGDCGPPPPEPCPGYPDCRPPGPPPDNLPPDDPTPTDIIMPADDLIWCELSSSNTPGGPDNSVRWTAKVYKGVNNNDEPVSLNNQRTFTWTGSDGLSKTTGCTGASGTRNCVDFIDHPYTTTGSQHANVTVSVEGIGKADCSSTAESIAALKVTCRATPSVSETDTVNGNTIVWQAFPTGGNPAREGYTYAWTFKPEPGTKDESVQGFFTTVYTSVGQKDGTVTVTDSSGKQASATCTATVQTGSPSPGQGDTPQPQEQPLKPVAQTTEVLESPMVGVSILITTNKPDSNTFYKGSPADDIGLVVYLRKPAGGVVNTVEFTIIASKIVGGQPATIGHFTANLPALTTTAKLTSLTHSQLLQSTNALEAGTYYYAATITKMNGAVPSSTLDPIKSDNTSTVFVKVNEVKNAVPETNVFFALLVVLAVIAIARLNQKQNRLKFS